MSKLRKFIESSEREKLDVWKDGDLIKHLYLARNKHGEYLSNEKTLNGCSQLETNLLEIGLNLRDI